MLNSRDGTGAYADMCIEMNVLMCIAMCIAMCTTVEMATVSCFFCWLGVSAIDHALGYRPAAVSGLAVLSFSG